MRYPARAHLAFQRRHKSSRHRRGLRRARFPTFLIGPRHVLVGGKYRLGLPGAGSCATQGCQSRRSAFQRPQRVWTTHPGKAVRLRSAQRSIAARSTCARPGRVENRPCSRRCSVVSCPLQRRCPRSRSGCRLRCKPACPSFLGEPPATADVRPTVRHYSIIPSKYRQSPHGGPSPLSLWTKAALARSHRSHSTIHMVNIDGSEETKGAWFRRRLLVCCCRC